MLAERFGKRHADVLRDVDNLLKSLTDADLRWLKPSRYVDEKGETRRSFDLTRDGFTLLVMGWTGERALQFKVRYIEAFNKMELALKSGQPGALMEELARVKSAVASVHHWHGRLDAGCRGADRTARGHAGGGPRRCALEVHVNLHVTVGRAGV